MTEKIKKSDADWRQELSPEQYAVLRQQATERPFTGEYVNSKAEGVYTCAACGNELFSSSNQVQFLQRLAQLLGRCRPRQCRAA